MSIAHETAHETAHEAFAGHFDVLIVGAGISGVGGAYHLKKLRPGTSFVVLESQDGFGGTWRTHRYPGIRSDSDLYTFGYGFKPWRGAPIATAAEINAYLAEVIDENALAGHIRYSHRIVSASWSGDERRWTLEVERTREADARSDGAIERLRFTTGFLWMCQGYYRHSKGYTPEWPEMASFRGRIVHPQTWPDDLALDGKRVVVIGSGATAATLIPSIAKQCAHVTMLQRSPTFFITGRNANVLADMLRELKIPDEWTHEIVRRKILFDQAVITRRSFSEPDKLREELLGAVRALLPEGFDIDKHFSPRYRPWRQRIAFIPDGDLFQCMREGKASVATDEIERFTETGLQLKSGERLDADIIVSATGFDLNVLGDIAFTIDGKPLDFSQALTWRGTMFTGVPNLAWVFGYFRASWTLRADLIAEFVCRLLGEMEERNAARVVPTLRDGEASMTLKAWVDAENFNPGYLMRGLHLLPKQGDHQPWLHTQDYMTEKVELPKADLGDGSLSFD